MKRILGFFLLLYLGFWCLAHAQTGWRPLAAAKVSVAAAYTGPGDYATFEMWWGFRAFSTADRGNKLVNICNVADAACADVSSDATTGNLTIPLIGGSDCTMVTCTIKTLYDRSGATFCSGAVACDMTQGTIANRMTLLVSCQNGHPCGVCNGATPAIMQTVANTSAQAQPLSESVVAKRTSGTAFSTAFSSDAGGAVQTGFSNSANNALQFAGTVVSIAATDNAFHALQAVYNGASSVFVVDGSSNNTSAGAGTFPSTSTPILCQSGSSGNPLTGDITEAGMSAGSFSAGTMTSINSNQRTYWNF